MYDPILLIFEVLTRFKIPDNFPEPGKRPLSSTAPTIIEHADGSFYLAIGGSGGSRIFPSVFQVLLNLEWGLDISSAIEFGRLHDQLYPLHVDADNVYPQDILKDLENRGHKIQGELPTTCIKLNISNTR